jgi:hypothetical protein
MNKANRIMKLPILAGFSLLLAFTLFACTQDAKQEKSNQFVLNGEINGKTDGYIYINIHPQVTMGHIQDSVMVKNGRFEYTCDLSIPSYFKIATDKNARMQGNLFGFFATNETILLKADADSLKNAVIEGALFNQEYRNFQDERWAYGNDVPGLKEVEEKRRKIFNGEGVSKEERADIKAEYEKLDMVRNERQGQITEKYIKEHPKSLVSLVLIHKLSANKSAVYLDQLIGYLDNETLGYHPVYDIYNKRLAEMSGTELSFDKLFPGVTNVAYKVDESFKGAALQDVVYLSTFSNNNICAVKADGTVQAISPDGKIASSFKPQVEGEAVSVAVDSKDNIYILSSVVEVKTIKNRGRKIVSRKPLKAICTIVNTKGEVQKTYELTGLVNPTGAKVAEDKLLVSDAKQKAIGIFNAQNGEKVSTIENLRSCCGIMDISVRNNNQLLVANLGAFRVSGYDLTGKKNLDFGQRGADISDFHGCCNPVSLTYLSNGAIVTVEKDPTRVKIFSQDGAKEVAGIEELVKGCSYIPMAVDGNDNLYLASAKKGIVKCVSL